MRLILGFLPTMHLPQLARRDARFDHFVTRKENLLGAGLPGRKLVQPNVVALALGKPIEEYGAHSVPVGNQGAKATGAALAWSRNALLDQPAAEVGIDQTTRGPLDSLAKTKIANTFAPGEARKPFGCQDPHSSNSLNYSS
jgi:hypothetical protein